LPTRCVPPYAAPPSFPTRRSSDLQEERQRVRRTFGVRIAPRGSGAFLKLEQFDRLVHLFDLGGGKLELVERRFDLLAVERTGIRSEEHTSELQSRVDLVCRLLLAK